MSKSTPTHPLHFIIAWCKPGDLDNPIQWNNRRMTRAEAERKVKQRPTGRFGADLLHAVAWNCTTHPLETE